MEETKLDAMNQEFAGADGGDQILSNCSMDSFFDDIFENNTHACTHTHTCNPPGPDLSHTHTCFHVHTKILSKSGDETAESTENEKGSGKKRSCGNREAVRKYREKKKARTASLEDENRELRAENQQLLKKLQSLAPLEAENMRLKCLLVDLRGRIDGEIGSFPYQRAVKEGANLVPNMAQLSMPGGAYATNACGLRCDDSLYCPPKMQGDDIVENGLLNGQKFGVCDVGNAPCMGGLANRSCGRGPVLSGCNSSGSERKGAHPTTEC